MDASLIVTVIGLAIGGIVFLLAWLNGPELITGWKRFERSYLERLHRALDAIYSRTDPKKYFYTHIAITTVLFIFVSYLLGPANGVLVSILVGLFPWLGLARAKRQRLERLEDQIPDALISMSNSLRAGLTLPQAIGILVDNTAPPIAQEFGLMLKEHKLGLTLDEAMNNMGERVRSKNLDLVITSVQVARVAGGNLPQVFEDTAEAIRDIRRLEDKIETMTAQGRMQAWVLGSLPVGMAVLIYKVDPLMVSPLWEDPIGWIILFFIALFEIVGIFMIRKIVSVDV
ncbi:MAG: type II secretion system F family protein [Deltaproteobacteria bacterium]|nr:type II secretion system F family protein [Deltaproteobacteria bacterium]